MSDYIVRAISADGLVQAAAICSRELTERARQIHHASPVATAALGRALAGASMMGNALKGQGASLTLQIKGGGPLGTVLASFFIQHITAGGAYVDKSLYCAQISDLISSIIIYLCGFVLFMKHVMNSSIAKREEKAALKAKAAAEQDAANGKGGDQA